MQYISHHASAQAFTRIARRQRIGFYATSLALLIINYLLQVVPWHILVIQFVLYLPLLNYSIQRKEQFLQTRAPTAAYNSPGKFPPNP